MPSHRCRSRINTDWFPSLRKQPTFGEATTGFPAKWRPRNKGRNSILMTRHYPDLGNASDWLNQISNTARPIRRTTQIWVVTRHQYGISAFVSQTSFGGKTSGSVAKCRLFFQASDFLNKRQMRKLLAGYRGRLLQDIFLDFYSLKSPFLGFRVRQDIGQISSWKVFLLVKIYLLWKMWSISVKRCGSTPEPGQLSQDEIIRACGSAVSYNQCMCTSLLARAKESSFRLI